LYTPRSTCPSPPPPPLPFPVFSFPPRPLLLPLRPRATPTTINMFLLDALRRFPIPRPPPQLFLYPPPNPLQVPSPIADSALVISPDWQGLFPFSLLPHSSSLIQLPLLLRRLRRPETSRSRGPCLTFTSFSLRDFVFLSVLFLLFASPRYAMSRLSMPRFPLCFFFFVFCFLAVAPYLLSALPPSFEVFRI